MQKERDIWTEIAPEEEPEEEPEADVVPTIPVTDVFLWRNLGLDLKIIFFWLGLTIVSIFIPVLNESPLRIIIALPVAIFIPGYCLIAALFPGNRDIDGIERIALSVGLSIIIVPLIGLWLNYTIWGIRLTPIVISLIVFTLCAAIVAQYRRLRLNDDERYQIVSRDIIKGIKDIFPSPRDVPRIRTFNAIVLIALIVAMCTIIIVNVIPKEGEKFTEFYILGRNETAVDYPTDLTEGSPEQIIIGIGNHEYHNTNYVVEVWLTNMTFNSTTNMTFLNQMEKLDQFSLSLQHNVFYQEPRRFTVPTTGFNKLTLLLFKNAAPSDSLTGYERINSSYRNLHIYLTVKPSMESYNMSEMQITGENTDFHYTPAVF